MNTNTFPLDFNQHLIFCIIAVLFLVLQFIRQRYWYQPVVAAAVAASLLIYVNDSENWFYSIGVAELVLMLTAMVLYIVQARKLAGLEKEKEQAENAAKAESPVAESPVTEAAAENVEEADASADVPAEERIGEETT